MYHSPTRNDYIGRVLTSAAVALEHVSIGPVAVFRLTVPQTRSFGER